MNVLYDGCTSRPTFIDFEGCQLVGNGTSIDKLTHKQKVALWKPPLAVNARLPELGKPFDPFAADCWMLGERTGLLSDHEWAERRCRRHASADEKVPRG